MLAGTEWLALICVLITLLWMTIGLGVARMISEINDRPLELIDVILWPVVTLIFAACKEVR